MYKGKSLRVFKQCGGAPQRHLHRDVNSRGGVIFYPAMHVTLGQVCRMKPSSLYISK